MPPIQKEIFKFLEIPPPLQNPENRLKGEVFVVNTPDISNTQLAVTWVHGKYDWGESVVARDGCHYSQ